MIRKFLKELAYGAADRAACLLYDKGLVPADAASDALAAEFRGAVSRLPPLPAESQQEKVDDRWLSFLRQVRKELANSDPRGFLRWPVIRETMFVSNGATSFRMWKALKRLPQWPRWQATLVEDRAGHPLPFLLSGRTSGNQVHLTHHLAQFEAQTGSRVDKMGLVFEFGGGYGNICRQVHRAGFHGKYVIFDLPEFNILQRYFLRSIGLPVLPHEDLAAPGRCGIALVSDIDVLRKVLPPAAQENGPAMFIATWSLSESPWPLRDQITPLLASFDGFLIGYQGEFNGMDNRSYFDGFAKGRPRAQWHQSAIPGMGANYYLFGTTQGARRAE